MNETNSQAYGAYSKQKEVVKRELSKLFRVGVNYFTEKSDRSKFYSALEEIQVIMHDRV